MERLRRDDETFDELLARLAKRENPIGVVSRSEEDAERSRTAVKRSRESFERSASDG